MLKRIGRVIGGVVAGLLVVAASIAALSGEEGDPRLRYLTPEELRVLQSHARQPEPQPTPPSQLAHGTVSVSTEEEGEHEPAVLAPDLESLESTTNSRLQEAKRESIRAAEAAALRATPRAAPVERSRTMAVAPRVETLPMVEQPLDTPKPNAQDKSSPEWVQKEQERASMAEEGAHAAAAVPLAPAAMAEAVVPPLRPEVAAAEVAPKFSQSSGRSQKAAIKDALRLMDRLEREMLGEKQ